jgi:hypothetical protein
MGLVLVNLGMCQQAQPGEKAGQAATPAPEGTKKPAAKEPKGKAEQPKAPKEQGKPSGAAAAPATPQKSADPGKLPGQFTPSEGC